eukprot:CAMPEP_0175103094 /NCGR_PEP_ID=MMETSP0086_2-20121207/8862_1 /TAXON_ID=136419 /ORGANISM="Unknown Unknown, Strain D1" /LENGTH=115 /DNA_ID=CAMNT_0016378099 /DNA_START=37 /DNA_END=384 /DNA_ORIENTATION=+
MSGIAKGMKYGPNKKGHTVTPHKTKSRQSQRKGKKGEKVAFVRAIVRDVAGFAPYEKRVMEILKGGGNNPQKRAWKFAKNRLGAHTRAKAKVAEMQDTIAAAAKVAAAAKASEGK